MARAPKSNTALVDWEKQMEADAVVAAAATRAMGAGGRFFSIRAGQLSFEGNPLPGNQMAVVVLGHVLENSYFDTPFDPDTPASPKCFAFGTEESEMEPHEAVDKDDYFERQHEQCSGCPQNEFGSARTGRGKACGNVMRLALIPAGMYKLKGGRNAGLDLDMFTDPDQFADTDVAYIKIPVMSVRNFSQYVKALAADIKRPPHGVFTNIVVEPDERSQVKVTFELIDNIPTSLLSTVMPRHAKVMEDIAFPYNPPQAREEAQAPTKVNKKLTRAR